MKNQEKITQNNIQTHKLIFEPKETIIPQENDCTLILFLGNRLDCPGKIILTDFRCVFKASIESLYHEENLKFDYPLGYISRCESSSQTINKIPVFYVQFWLKFGFQIKVKSSNVGIFRISEYMSIVLTENDGFGQKRASELDQTEKCKKWEDVQEQFAVDQAVFYDNQAWKYLPLYPQSFKVPKPFVGKRSQHDRLVMLSYVYNSKNKAGLWRTGPGKNDNEQSIWIPAANKKTDHFVVEIKTKAINSMKSLAEFVIQLDGPIQLRESIMKFYTASCYQNEQISQQQKWIVNANFSKWLEQISILVSESFSLAEKLTSGVNITVLSDWDVRGSQISALIQVLLQPESRTILGFGKLIERQFCHFGNYVAPAAKRQRLEDKGLALIQFLDCVYQITKVYSLSFEYNEDFLAFVATHVYSRKYGNFLYMTQATTELNVQKSIRYACIWVEAVKKKQKYLNPFFVSHKDCDIYELKKNIGAKNFRIWGSFFLKDIMMYSNNVEVNTVNMNQRQILLKHWIIKTQTDSLRAKVAEQHRLINQKKKKLKQLQSMQLD